MTSFKTNLLFLILGYKPTRQAVDKAIKLFQDHPQQEKIYIIKKTRELEAE